MPDAAYTLVWAAIAVKDLLRLDADDAHIVLNNAMTLLRDPYPPLSDEAADGLFFLHVGRVSVAYEVLGFTVRMLAIETRDGLAPT